MDVERVLRNDGIHGCAVVGFDHDYSANARRLSSGGDEISGGIVPHAAMSSLFASIFFIFQMHHSPMVQAIIMQKRGLQRHVIIGG